MTTVPVKSAAVNRILDALTTISVEAAALSNRDEKELLAALDGIWRAAVRGEAVQVQGVKSAYLSLNTADLAKSVSDIFGLPANDEHFIA